VVNFPSTVFASLIKSTASWTYGQPQIKKNLNFKAAENFNDDSLNVSPLKLKLFPVTLLNLNQYVPLNTNQRTLEVFSQFIGLFVRHIVTLLKYKIAKR
jgi:hypothetical protein